MTDRLSSAGYKRLYALSRNECAFRDCTRPVTVEHHGTPVTTSEAAHIVAKSRQGPRGRVEIADDERRGVLNHLLFCDEHHKIVDASPRVYSVGVLQKMKADHEAKMARRAPSQPELPTTSEDVRITALPVVGLPAQVYSARALKPDFISTVRSLSRPSRRDAREESIPFLHDRDGTIWAFHDLSRRDGPFSRVVRRDSTESHPAREVWATEDGHRRYVRLLKQTLGLHVQGRGLEWDKRHKRYWFPADTDGAERAVRVPTKRGQNRSRPVAYEQRYRSDEGKGAWCHWALEWRFEHVAEDSWVLATRPAYQWTTDGSTLLDPDLIGRKAAQKMAHVYNVQYFDQVHFWQTWLTEGKPRLVLPVGHASLVISSEAPLTSITWPTIGDETFTPTGPADDDLLTYLDYQGVLDIDPDDLYVEEPDPEPDPAKDDAA
jgi:hypothetical protein